LSRDISKCWSLECEGIHLVNTGWRGTNGARAKKQTVLNPNHAENN